MYGAPEHPTPPEGEELFPITSFLETLRRRLWMILLVPILMAGTTIGIMLAQPPIYEATATVAVSAPPGSNPQDNFDNTITGLQTLANEMQEVGITPSMRDSIRAQVGGSEVSPSALQNNLTVEQRANTRFLDLTYRDNEQERTQLVANVAAEVFASQIAEASGVAGTVTVKRTIPAPLPKNPVAPDPFKGGLLALAMGVMLGTGFALLLTYLDRMSLRSPERVEQISGLPVFGTIPDFKRVASKK